MKKRNVKGVVQRMIETTLQEGGYIKAWNGASESELGQCYNARAFLRRKLFDAHDRCLHDRITDKQWAWACENKLVTVDPKRLPELGLGRPEGEAKCFRDRFESTIGAASPTVAPVAAAVIDEMFAAAGATK